MAESENYFSRNLMKFSLLLTGLMVGLPKSSLEPGCIFTSRNDGPGQDTKSMNFCSKSAGLMAIS
jgi:hypothetical protein